MSESEHTKMLVALQIGDVVKYKADESIKATKVFDTTGGFYMKISLGSGEIRTEPYSYLTCDSIKMLDMLTGDRTVKNGNKSS